MGCGVDNHNQDCLCDVRHLRVQVDRDAVSAMWQGKRIAEILGTDFTDDSDVIEWFATIVDVHDKWVEAQGEFCEAWEVLPPLCISDGRTLQQWAQIRRSVNYALKTFPVTSVIQVLNKLCIDIELFMTAFTTNKFTQKMTYEWWQAFEQDMLAEKPCYAEIGRKHGLSRQVVTNFRGVLKPIKDRLHGHVGFQRV